MTEFELYYNKPYSSLEIIDLGTKVQCIVTDAVTDKKTSLTFSDIALATYLKVSLTTSRETFIKNLRNFFNKPITKNKILLRKVKSTPIPYPEEWEVQAYNAIVYMDTHNKLSSIDKSYIQAFDNKVYMKVYLDTLYNYYKNSIDKTMPEDILTLHRNPELLYVIDEPTDS